MKQVTQNYKTGHLYLDEVPVPDLKPNGVLVRNCHSAISIGTEMMKVQTAKMNLLEKARSRPQEIKKVINSVKQQGLLDTYKKVMHKLDTPTSLGYSASGIIVEVSAGLDEFSVGDRVAIAGAGYANHAEINFVPKNLCVRIPDNVSSEDAAFTTVGAIAIQGIRQAKIQFGETVAVIGMGLIGLIASKILLATGHNVIGIDIDNFKTDFARKCGIRNIALSGKDDVLSLVMSSTGGIGVDAALITTGTKSNAPIELAAGVVRDRGKVVDIGITKMDIPWKAYYEKELELIFSRSYGPGRYDANYEEKGIDYPIGYVRWTERRNMESFLTLVSTGKLSISDLITHRFKFDEAEKVYNDIVAKKMTDFLGVVFDYGKFEASDTLKTKIDIEGKRKTYKAKDKIVLGCIGAGNFAKSMLMPHITCNNDVILKAVATSTGISAKNTAKKFGFEYATSSSADILNDDSINTIIISTRHNLHARFIISSLRHKKNVYVEKPLALNNSELDEIADTYREICENGYSPFLMVGYNRRFAPLSTRLKEFFARRNNPLLMHYRINAGMIPVSSWYQDPVEGGGRIIGEVCHFIDYMVFLTGSLPARVFAMPLKSTNKNIPVQDNVSINIEFRDGSVGNIIYTAIGSNIFPKEYIEVFGENSVGALNNFSSIELYKDNKKEKKKSMLDKGHSNEMKKLVDNIKMGIGSPISFNELASVSLSTFGICRSLENNSPIEINLK